MRFASGLLMKFLLMGLGVFVQGLAANEVQGQTLGLLAPEESCELSLNDQVRTFLGHLKEQIESGQITANELLELRDLLLHATDSNGIAPSPHGADVGRQLRTRVALAFKRQLSADELHRFVVGLQDMMEIKATNQVVRAEAEARTNPSHNRLHFLPVEPGLTVMVHASRKGSDHLLRYYRSHDIKTKVTESFLVSENLVTQLQWKLVMGSLPSNFDGSFQASDVIRGFSYVEVDRFLERLNHLLETSDPTLNMLVWKKIPRNAKFTLPSNAQWSLFIDHYGAELPDVHSKTWVLGELLRDELMKRKIIPRWTMINPVIAGEDPEKARLVVVHRGGGHRTVWWASSENMRNSHVGFRVALVTESNSESEKAPKKSIRFWTRLLKEIDRRLGRSQ